MGATPSLEWGVGDQAKALEAGVSGTVFAEAPVDADDLVIRIEPN